MLKGGGEILKRTQFEKAGGLYSVCKIGAKGFEDD